MLLIHTMTNFVQSALFSAVAALAAPETEAPDLTAEDSDNEVSERAQRFCSASDPNSATGRQWAMVKTDSRNPGVCIRKFLGGEAPEGTPDCWKAGRGIGCNEIYDDE